MDDGSRHQGALAGTEVDGLLALDVDDQVTGDDEEELILGVVFVPVKVAVENPHADHAVVDRTQSLVEPRLVLIDDFVDIDEAEAGDQRFEDDSVVRGVGHAVEFTRKPGMESATYDGTRGFEQRLGRLVHWMRVKKGESPDHGSGLS